MTSIGRLPEKERRQARRKAYKNLDKYGYKIRQKYGRSNKKRFDDEDYDAD